MGGSCTPLLFSCPKHNCAKWLSNRVYLYIDYSELSPLDPSGTHSQGKARRGVSISWTLLLLFLVVGFFFVFRGLVFLSSLWRMAFGKTDRQHALCHEKLAFWR